MPKPEVGSTTTSVLFKRPWLDSDITEFLEPIEWALDSFSVRKGAQVSHHVYDALNGGDLDSWKIVEPVKGLTIALAGYRSSDDFHFLHFCGRRQGTNQSVEAGLDLKDLKGLQELKLQAESVLARLESLWQSLVRMA